VFSKQLAAPKLEPLIILGPPLVAALVILGRETNWHNKSDTKVFVNFTRKLKVVL